MVPFECLRGQSFGERPDSESGLSYFLTYYTTPMLPVLPHGPRVFKALGVGAVIVFGLTVWPTPYRYDHMNLGGGASLPVRTNRITGHTEILYQGGWQAASPARNRELSGEELRQLDVQAHLEQYPDEDWIELRVYNGSKVEVVEITAEVTVRDGGTRPPPDPLARMLRDPDFRKLNRDQQRYVVRKVSPSFSELGPAGQDYALDKMLRDSQPLESVKRRYTLTPRIAEGCRPNSVVEFRARLGFHVGASQPWSWTIMSAKGK